MEYNEAILTVMIYFGLLTLILLFCMGFYLFRKFNKILNKLSYVVDHEVKIRDEND